MADEAFALSPISARAAQPSEEDYAAISEAFMETSRGRWFLGEYAKRNRNADTRLVLDAVARIEESIAAQKQATADNTLADALAAIRAAVGDAQSAASAALDGLALDQHLMPIRRGVRVMREISWRLREIGADGRICDIIDSQAAVIEASAGQISASPARDAQDAAFAALMAQIEDYSRDDDAAAAAARPDANVVPFPAPAEDAASAVTEAAAEPVAVAEPVAEAIETVEATAVAAPDVVAEVVTPDTAAPEMAAPVIEPDVALSDEAADAHDEAVLDLIAAEMAAPQPADDIDDFEITIAEARPDVEPAPVVAETVTQDVAVEEIFADAPVVDVPVAEVIAAVATVEAPVAQPVVAQAASEPVAMAPAVEAVAEVSLGSTILASGILKKPARTVNDALAPIRRMSQAEKIAFFS